MTTRQELREIFYAMFNHLKKIQVDGQFDRNIEDCRTRVGRFYSRDDDYFFKYILMLVFENKVKIEVAHKKWNAIYSKLGDFRKVAQYEDKKIEELINDKDIRLWGISKKVPATVCNAREMNRIIEEYGSFRKYLESFVDSEGLRKDMKKRFKEIGGTNARAFQKYVGFVPMVKDDKNVRRILARLGLIESENVSFRKIRAVCEAMSEAVGENLNVIDEVFWAYGGGVGVSKRMCGTKPLCKECPLTNYCRYYKNRMK